MIHGTACPGQALPLAVPPEPSPAPQDREGKTRTAGAVSSHSPVQPEGAPGCSQQLLCPGLCRLAAVAAAVSRPLSMEPGIPLAAPGQVRKSRSSEKHQCLLQS